MSKMTMVRELSHFLMKRKRYWIVPMVTVLLLLGVLLVVAEGSAVAPFIYTLF